MNTKTLWSVVFGIVVGCAVLLPLVQASEQDQETKVMFDQPVEVPGSILPAGSYWFERDADNIYVVRIFSGDWKTLYATEQTVETGRLKPANDPTFIFAERESSKPEALLTWFFPGETIGHEFQYPRQEEKELAQDAQQVVVATPIGEPRGPLASDSRLALLGLSRERIHHLIHRGGKGGVKLRPRLGSILRSSQPAIPDSNFW
jgi:hypothetical protein